MTVSTATAQLVASAFAAWTVSDGAARRRAIPIGAFPSTVVVGVLLMMTLSSGVRAPFPALIGVTVVAAVVDARCGLIFDALTLGLVVAASAGAACSGSLTVAAQGAAVVASVPLVLYVITRGRGFGLGDVKLAAGIGAAAGPESGLAVLAVAFIAAGAYAAVALSLGRAGRGSRVCFGPFLALGTCAVALPGAR